VYVAVQVDASGELGSVDDKGRADQMHKAGSVASSSFTKASAIVLHRAIAHDSLVSGVCRTVCVVWCVVSYMLQCCAVL
jgi:hypothetical protein